MNRTLISGALMTAAGIAGWFIAPARIVGIAGDLIQFFSILAALSVQAMVLTAAAFQPGALDVTRAEAVMTALHRRQRGLIYLFIYYLVAIIAPLLLKLLGPSEVPQAGTAIVEATSTLSAILSALTCATGVFAIARSIFVLFDILDLHSFRDQQIRDQMRADTAAKAAEARDRIAAMRPVPPSGSASYGETVEFRSFDRK